MKQIRSNQQWLDELRGRQGVVEQQQAHLDLANYLYIVAYRYLVKRQVDVSGLHDWTPAELAELAQDCVQDVLEKLARDNFALLSKYHGAGAFTAWAAVIIRNQIATLLRRSPFTSKQIELEAIGTLTSPTPTPTTLAARTEVIAALQDCLNRLTEQSRVALLECVVNDASAKQVAASLKKTAGAIYLTVLRAKRQVSECLAAKGYGQEVLELF